MAETLYIQRDALRTRVVLCRDGAPIELRLASSRGRRLAGNIYRGRVARIVPEMKAAFVDIGTERMGMLPVNAVWLPSLAQERAPANNDQDVPGAPRGNPLRRDIDTMLEVGQEVMVQVVREPVAKKGPRVTMFPSLPGKNLVFLGREPHIGVSKRIDQPEERNRLRAVIDRLLPRSCGAVVRTVGENATEAELANDIAFLRAQWDDLVQRYRCASAPSFLLHEADVVLAALRDLVTPATEEVWLSRTIEREQVVRALSSIHPESRPVVRVHDGPEDLLAAHGLASAITSTIATRVALPGGGDVVIDRAEAGTFIDVNAGQRIGDERREDLVLRLNLTAAKEIARQLRLRNIGGLVVIDFVDMRNVEDRRMLEAVLESELSDDPARLRLSRVDRFGLVVLARKQERESIYSLMTEPCQSCGGAGYVRSAADLAIDALARLRRGLQGLSAEDSVVTLTVPGRVAAVLNGELSDVLGDIEKANGVQVTVRVLPTVDGDGGVAMKVAR